MDRKTWAAPLLFGVVVLGAWVAATSTGAVDRYFLPAPQDILSRLVEGLGEGYLRSAFLVTLAESLLGALAAATLGVPLGYWIAKSRLFSLVVAPYLAASQAIPAVAVAPLMAIWIGYDMASIVALCAVMVVFPVIVTTSTGVRQLDPEVIGAARLDGAHGWTLARHMEIPLAAPSILAGLRTGFTLSITGAIVGEMVVGGTGHGLGIQLASAQQSGDVTGMFAAIALLVVGAVGVYAFFGLVERGSDRAGRSPSAQPGNRTQRTSKKTHDVRNA